MSGSAWNALKAQADADPGQAHSADYDQNTCLCVGDNLGCTLPTGPYSERKPTLKEESCFYVPHYAASS